MPSEISIRKGRCLAVAEVAAGFDARSRSQIHIRCPGGQRGANQREKE